MHQEATLAAQIHFPVAAFEAKLKPSWHRQKLSQLSKLWSLSPYNIWMFPVKIGKMAPKMDGENNGNPGFKMDDFRGKTHYFRKHPDNDIHNCIYISTNIKAIETSWMLVQFSRHPGFGGSGTCLHAR